MNLLLIDIMPENRAYLLMYYPKYTQNKTLKLFLFETK